MNILVVGGAGYIGGHVALDLLEKGHRLTIFDNLSSGDRANVLDEAAIVCGDITSEEDLRSVFAQTRFDAVFHFAALKAAGDSMTTPEIYAKQNISGTINLLNAMSQANVKKLVFSSSAGVFGHPHYNPIDEDHPKEPCNFYGHTKLIIEQLLEWYSRLLGFRFAAPRYFNAAGHDPQGRIPGIERETKNLIPLVMETALGLRTGLKLFGTDYDTPDGTCIRDYVHVTDLAAAHTAALDYLEQNNQNLIFNLGNGSGFSVLDIIETARRVSGREINYEVVPRRPGDPDRLIASSKLAFELLKWQPVYTDLTAMISTSWDAYQRTFTGAAKS